MPEREYVAPEMSKAESDLREKWDQLWHDNKDRSTRDMLLELFCAVMFPQKEATKVVAETEQTEVKPTRR